MATSTYAFVLTLDANQALAAAKKWRAALEKELGSIQVGGLAGGGTTAGGKIATTTTQLGGLDGMLRSVAQSSSLMNAAIMVAGGAGILYLGKRALQTTVDLGQVGNATTRLRDSFEELAAQAGGSADEMLKAIQRASGGTISELDAMAAANKGMLLGLGADAEQWGQLIEVARFRARAMGLTVTEAVDDITTAIGRETPRIADNLGIIWDMDRIMGDYAATIGKTASELTAVERKQALLTDTIRIGQDQIAKAGGLTSDYADAMERLNAAWQNRVARTGELLGPTVSKAVDTITGYLTAMDPLSAPLISAAADAKAAGAGFREMAEAVADAETKLRAWYLKAEAIDELGISVKLTGDQLVAIGEIAGVTGIEIIELARELGIDLPAGFIAAETSGARWAAVAAQFPAQLDATAASASGLVPAIWDLVGAYTGLAEQMIYTASVGKSVWGTLLETPGRDELAQRAGVTASSGWTKITGLAGILSAEQLQAMGAQYMSELTNLYQRLDGEETGFIEAQVAVFQAGWDKRIQKVRESAKEIGKVQTSIGKSADQAYSAFRSAVSGALQPTAVTALDMAQSGAGVYADKWDEHARRIRDAMTNMQSPWRKMIPTDIEQAGEGAIQQWGQGQLDQFYSGMMPDQVNWDAFARDFQKTIDQQAGRENLIDRAMQELNARGINTERGDVQKALGLSSPLEQMFFGGATPEQAGTQLQSGVLTALSQVKLTPEEAAGPAGLVTQSLAKGIEDEFAEVAWTAVLVAAWTKNMVDNSSSIVDTGRALGRYIFEGMRDELEDAGIVDAIVDVVFSELARAAE